MVISLKKKTDKGAKNVAVDRIDERGEKMALRGKRKRKKAKRGATPDARNTNGGNGGSGRGVTGTKTKRKNTQNPGTKQTANNTERGRRL